MGHSTRSGFAGRLKALREAAGFTQQQLADVAGLGVFTVAKIEQGVREPGWPTVLALADALGATPNDFLPAARKKKQKP